MVVLVWLHSSKIQQLMRILPTLRCLSLCLCPIWLNLGVCWIICSLFLGNIVTSNDKPSTQNSRQFKIFVSSTFLVDISGCCSCQNQIGNADYYKLVSFGLEYRCEIPRNQFIMICIITDSKNPIKMYKFYNWLYFHIALQSRVKLSVRMKFGGWDRRFWQTHEYTP